MKIPFYKYHGAGNDFILIDNRNHDFDRVKSTDTVHRLCHRHFGIGADGLMFLEKDSEADFDMIYYNADGNPGSLCGNGGRCIAALAYRLGLAGELTRFKASDGLHEARIVRPDYVELKMNPVSWIELHDNHAVLNTGSPHYISLVSGLADFPVVEKGREIRYSDRFPGGINVNFVEKENDRFLIRTYERGVEDETWACGTGATAAALALAELDKTNGEKEITLQARGGPLTVRFERLGPGRYDQIWLCGEAVQVYEGQINIS